MKKIIFGILFLILTLTMKKGFSTEISLPKELKARAQIIKSKYDDLWEKTLVITFDHKRKALSTFEFLREVRAVINHSAHPEIWKKVCEERKTKKSLGGRVYLEKIREKIGKDFNLSTEEIFILGTAADMDNLAVVTKTWGSYVVTALVTAGAKTNALRAGFDEGNYTEEEKPQGTVNIIILTNKKLRESAMARAIITATEAKTAAFQDLKVPSSYNPQVQATGTGTDNIIIVSGEEPPEITYTGGHSKIGELIAKAVYQAVKEALIKQNHFK
ncbi:hypothetical protein THC_0606 [Caldimicrobium thiodismutans]|uniref:Adenosylcobinamide amidohydrolase n=2 Tax=Caldimicrobium thiodismutans TaxID=1653476 RepID=A0A0U5AUT9_9BACT|nr:hypothetical protein THC_0606 [Caldimicrobium thiodismutans]